jgi:hypothetical protein
MKSRYNQALISLSLISAVIWGAFLVKWHSNLSTMKVFMLEYSFFAVLGLSCFTLLQIKPKKSTSNNFCLNSRHQKILDSVFFLSISLAVFVLQNALYVKPLSHYVFLSLAIAVLGVKIFFSDAPKSKFVLFQIFMLAFVIGSSKFIINPYLTGPDTYFHYFRASEVVDNGMINKKLAGAYAYHPFTQIWAGICMLILGKNEAVFFLSLFSMSALSIFFMFLIIKNVASDKVAFISAYLLVFSAPLLYTLTTPSPQNQAIPIILLSVVALLALDRSMKY